ncbi:MAG: hypothetical protein ABI040_10745 [Rhodoferax sp.]
MVPAQVRTVVDRAVRIAQANEGYGSPTAERAEEDNAYARTFQAHHKDDDPHLRSCNAVVGDHIHANDGDIGHV